MPQSVFFIFLKTDYSLPVIKFICGGFNPPVFIPFSSTLYISYGLSLSPCLSMMAVSSSKYFLIHSGEAAFARSSDNSMQFWPPSHDVIVPFQC